MLLEACLRRISAPAVACSVVGSVAQCISVGMQGIMVMVGMISLGMKVVKQPVGCWPDTVSLNNTSASE